MSAASYYALKMLKSCKTEQIEPTSIVEVDLGSHEQQKVQLEPEGTVASSVKSEKICRACTMPGKIPISGTKDDLITALRKICDIAIDAKDKLPKYLCKSCFDALLSSMKFRAMVRNSDKILRKQFKEPTSSNSNHYDDCSNDNSSTPIAPKPKPRVKPEKKKRPTDQKPQNNPKIKKSAVMALKYLQPESDEKGYYDDDDETFEAKHSYRHCDYCDLTFNSYQELNDHRRTQEHKTAKKKCTVCHKVVLAKNFKLHMRYHDQDYSHVCDICGGSFITKLQFETHKQTHGSMEFPYVCEFCPYRTHVKTALKKHIVIHFNEMPYQCAQCPKGFKFICNLKRHMLSHKTEYSFHCNICQKGFHQNRALAMHVKVDHEGIKEHVCNICGKEFGYRQRMMKHQLKVHKREKLLRGRMPLYLLQEKQEKDTITGC